MGTTQKFWIVPIYLFAVRDGGANEFVGKKITGFPLPPHLLQFCL